MIGNYVNKEQKGYVFNISFFYTKIILSMITDYDTLLI